MIICNATPLIYLGKLKQLDLLKKIFKEIVIPLEVKQEVVDKGKELQQPDAFLVEKEIAAGWIKVKETKESVKIPFPLDKGEHAVLSLAVEKKANIVLLDEISARTAAKILTLQPRGTIFILLEALKNEHITFVEFLALLHQLAQEGFRLQEEVYTFAIEEARKLKK